MKKLLTIFTTLILLLTIVACGKVPDTFAEFKVKDYVESTSIGFEIEITDPDDEIKGDIVMTLTRLEDNKVSSKTTTKEQLKEDLDEDKRVEFTSLKIGEKYEFEIKTTVNEKHISVFKKSYTTSRSSQVDIKTTEDFLKVKERRSASYTLKNDLDFADVDEDDIKKGLITIFSGTFDGKGHTIKNLTIESTSINIGLFGQLSGSATIKDLNLENVVIKSKGTSTGSKRMGILYGQNTSRSASVSNITISNSTLEANLNGFSNYHEIGFLAGASVAKVNDIFILDNNTMEVNQQKFQDVKIGGLIGKVDNSSTEDVIVENIVSNGNINYKVNQDDENGLEKSKASINIGGVFGQANGIKLKNVVAMSNITVEESTFALNKLEDKQRVDSKILIDVAGISAKSVNITLTDILSNPTIDVSNLVVENNLDSDSKYGYELRLNTSSILTQTSASNHKFKNVLRFDGEINLANFTDESFKVTKGVIFAKASNIDYGRHNSLGVNKESLSNEGLIKVFELDELFEEESFVYKNFNN